MPEVPGENEAPGTGGGSMPGPANSVIRFLEERTGEAPHVSLRDEDSASVSAPLIDPSSQEKLSVPHGRGNYQLMGEIARGGMGVVLKGHDTDLGRDIAVKVLDKRLCDRMDVVQRFVEEAQIGGQLQHPGIVPVYELGLMQDERPYFTMKLVKGRTLAALLAQRETPTSNRGRLIDIFESVCQTMAYAHSRGVIHRDLKPANIMVGAFGEVQVVDWGLAKVLVRGGTADEKLSRDAHATRTILETVRSEGSGSGTQSMVGSVLGTPAYMPPEQASGQVMRLDERSDVFALGAILCEILTGSPPYVGDKDEVISAAAQAELDDALARLDACEADAVLIKATKQCLMAAPAARPADAGVLAERIHDYVMSNEERAHRAEVEAAEASVRAQAESKARRLTLALGAAVMAIVLVGSGGWLWVQNEKATQERAESQRLQVAAEREQVLRDEVNAAMNEAAVLEGAERWEEAIAAAERARALAEGGDADGKLLAMVGASLQELKADLARAQVLEDSRLDTQRLLAELRQVAQSDEQSEDTEKDAAYRDIFLSHGIDLDEGELEAAAEQLTRRGLGSDVALALDAWGEVRRLGRDPEGALRLLELAHLVDPDPDRAHLREAVAGRYLEELRYLASEGLAGQPASTFALLATSLLRLEDRDLALSVFRSGLELHPDDFELHYLLALEQTPGPGEWGDPEELREARRHYSAALAIDPTAAWARNFLARVLDRLGEPEQALKQLELAIELDPETPEFWFRKAQRLEDLGREDEAIEMYERCTRFAEKHWVIGWGHSELAAVTARRGEHERALEMVRRAMDTDASLGNSIRAWMLRAYAVIGVASGEEAPLLEAREYLARDLLGMPEADRNYSGMLIYIARPPHEEDDGLERSAAGVELLLTHAVEVARIGLERAPEMWGLWWHLGVAQHLRGDPEAAIAALTRQGELYAEGDEDPRRLFVLAMCHHALGDEVTAREWNTRAVTWVAAHPERSNDEVQWLRSTAARVLGER